MEIIKVDYSRHKGLNCPITDRFFAFEMDEWDTEEVVEGSIIAGILDQEVPDQALFANEEFCKIWTDFYNDNIESNDDLFLEELVEMFKLLGK